MDLKLWSLLIFQALTTAQGCFKDKMYLGLRNESGEPLFLTPFIQNNNIALARLLSEVHFTESLSIESYAGFITVNETYNSNHFFWYFVAMNNNINAPIVVWLQGGPGESSLYGIFFGNGPLRMKHNKIEGRVFNWALSHHIIYIDNPVGAGFSFTKNSEGYCTNQIQIGEQLYLTLIQFFLLFPELQKNSVFITGESYAGKYVPALAYTIHNKNPTAQLKINLQGIAIGNGLSDPINQLVYSQYFYQIGLIDWNQIDTFQESEKTISSFIQNNQWEKSVAAYNSLFRKFFNMSGFSFYFNYLHTKDYMDFKKFDLALQKTNLRSLIHVGNLPFNHKSVVEKHLVLDFMKSVAPWISELLDHYKVLIYSGQLDIVTPYPMTVNYLRKLNFNGASEYRTAKRHVWKVDDEVAGYVKEGGNLVEVFVRNAGHMVTVDQPKWALDMITKFTHGKSFIPKH